jgi:uncharacterized lipoprotein YddW (UPF0748 family)
MTFGSKEESEMSKVWKATWLHKLPSTPEDVKTVARRLANAGFDLLIPCIKQVTGIADYHSRVANVRAEYRDWDPLMVLAEEANAVGLAVHAWCCVFPEGEDSKLLNARPELVAVPTTEKPRGEPQFRLACPNRPEVQDYEAALYQELIDNYPISGVHLDYIRFMGGLCFCEVCQKSYREATGGDLNALKFFEWNNPAAQDMDAWIDWRCEVITRFVRRIRKASRKGGKELSAAVFHYHPGGLLDIGQDWEAWVREGLLDYVFPMNYSQSTHIAAKWARNNVAALAGAPSDCRHWQGLLRPACMSTSRFVRHVRAVLDAGVEGFTIFEYPYLRDEDLAALKAL